MDVNENMELFVSTKKCHVVVESGSFLYHGNVVKRDQGFEVCNDFSLLSLEKSRIKLTGNYTSAVYTMSSCREAYQVALTAWQLQGLTVLVSGPSSAERFPVLAAISNMFVAGNRTVEIVDCDLTQTGCMSQHLVKKQLLLNEGFRFRENARFLPVHSKSILSALRDLSAEKSKGDLRIVLADTKDVVVCSQAFLPEYTVLVSEEVANLHCKMNMINRIFRPVPFDFFTEYFAGRMFKFEVSSFECFETVDESLSKDLLPLGQEGKLTTQVRACTPKPGMVFAAMDKQAVHSFVLVQAIVPKIVFLSLEPAKEMKKMFTNRFCKVSL